MVSSSIALQLATTSANPLTSLELDRKMSQTDDVPNIVINLGGPPPNVPCHYHLPYYPLFIFWQQVDGSMLRLDKLFKSFNCTDLVLYY